MPQPAGFSSRYTAPGYSSSRSSNVSYDYEGLDDHIKRQDALAATRDAKFASLYGGDVAGSVVAGNKIRDLLKTLRANAPGTTERDPYQIASPLVRVSSQSSSNKSDVNGDTSEFAQSFAKGKGVAAPPVAPPPNHVLSAPKPKRTVKRDPTSGDDGNILTA